MIQQLLFTVTLLWIFEVVNAEVCFPGVLLPVWRPQDDLTTGERCIRGFAYLVVMIYCFIGVSIVSDRFMGAIEVITSKQKAVKLHTATGENVVFVVRVWNDTVANLTLMALGSSAPEILLSVIEICGRLARGNFDSASSELGPGTIVGSAAFNLLIIIAICVSAIPKGEIRTINHLRVFMVTAIWSVFAYLWLLVILQLTSPGVVDIWEAVLTFLFFPLTVATAYLADQKLFTTQQRRKSYRIDKHGVIHEAEHFELEEKDSEFRQLGDALADYSTTINELRKENRNEEADKIEVLAKEAVFALSPKTRAYYRMQATRLLTSGQNLQAKAHDHHLHETLHSGKRGSTPETMDLNNPDVISIYFDPDHYIVLESDGKVEVIVKRSGGDLDEVVRVDYKSEDGSATENEDYVPVEGMLVFRAGETEKKIEIKIIDDDTFELDEQFYIHLSNPRVGSKYSKKVQLANSPKATITIIDDDHAGVFSISDKEINIVESIGHVPIKICRHNGCRGKVTLNYTTIGGTAKAGKEFQQTEGTVTFSNNELEQTILVPIINEDTFEKKDVNFFFQISNAVLLNDKGSPMPVPPVKRKSTVKDKRGVSTATVIALVGWPKIGEIPRTKITIRESQEFKETVDELLQSSNAAAIAGTTSWSEQFIEAFTVDPNEAVEGEEEPPPPSMIQYVIHFLTLFWKILFAIIPPTNIYGGYLTFVSSIIGIGILTALIGDLASHFGCSVGLKDSVTAITFVALGTSIPDTFASKVAAVQDEYADASIGNVTGSNAVNVFLGIGIAWTIAAIAYACRKCDPAPECNQFKVDPGNLGFSVTLFCSVAVVAIVLILVRRMKVFGGGELGGPRRYRYPTSFLLCFLWLFYILMSSLEAYGIIQGF